MFEQECVIEHLLLSVMPTINGYYGDKSILVSFYEQFTNVDDTYFPVEFLS